MKNKYNQKGFSLIEILGVALVLVIIFLLSIPIVLNIIKYSKKEAFKNSASNVLEAVSYYIAENKFTTITESGIKIEEISDLKIKNNNFEKGLIIKNKNNKLEIVYLIQGDYCAKGTIDKLKVSDKGCGYLDETKPSIASLSIIAATNNSIKVLASGYDEESKIIKYEFSIDSKKYVTNDNKQNATYLFENLESGEHTFSLIVTNEAGLKTKSEEYTFNTFDIKNINCKINTSSISSYKTVTCEYPTDENYIYQYATKNNDENLNYENIVLTNNTYEFKFENKDILYTRVLYNNEVIAQTSVNINNIDNILNEATPKLDENMIPVIYDENKNCWLKADPKTIYWDYQNKKWANAVVVKEKAASNNESHSREYYLSDVAINQPIYEADILAFYVWIPRFAYKIWNVNSVENNKNEEQQIDIIFQKTNEYLNGMTDDLINNGNYYTHPAFVFGDKDISGFWISKFQTSLSSDEECYKNPNISNCNKSSGVDIYSIPNVKPINYISISSAYILSKNMNIYGNIYGIKNTSNTHLIKNTQWGALTYLSHSIYGNDVIITNKSNITGGNNYKINVEQSTTGNIYGVYDTGGLLKEAVMGNYNNDPGLDYNNQSGFVGLNGSVEWPSSKYYDLYNGITYKSAILGDATGETNNWYDSQNVFVNGTNPFFIRGGNYNDINNLFNYDAYPGSALENVTFRFSFIFLYSYHT
ncbi:MAG: type II secretion system protein [Bacilli bacterium]|nr:type II secretion system protein [Bacilli bacterium]